MGLSFGKLVVLALAIAVVWLVFKYRRRSDEVSRAFRREAEARRANPRPVSSSRAAPAEDLVKCDACGAYVSAHAGACGRPDCPWGR
ncbi:MAG TPA: hypothetical protein VN802_16800 [Stellaceae bacterium]|nr:hypothetical protein [Stellaceae bacterium]